MRSAGTAIVQRGPGERAEFAIRDLSAKGARLVGATRLVDGERVHVELEIDGAVVSLAAVVVRTDPQLSQAAIEFRDVPEAALDSIVRAIETMIARARDSSAPRVLVVHPDEDVRAALERDLARLSRGAMLAASLDEGRAAAGEYLAAIIADAYAGELLPEVAERHPRARRIVLFGDQLGSVDRTWSAQVDAILRTPVRIRALSRALGITTTDSSIALLPQTDDE